jgi:hypothetical protein
MQLKYSEQRHEIATLVFSCLIRSHLFSTTVKSHLSVHGIRLCSVLWEIFTCLCMPSDCVQYDGKFLPVCAHAIRLCSVRWEILTCLCTCHQIVFSTMEKSYPSVHTPSDHVQYDGKISPVCAHAIRSRLFSMIGMAYFCTGVGLE